MRVCVGQHYRTDRLHSQNNLHIGHCISSNSSNLINTHPRKCESYLGNTNFLWSISCFDQEMKIINHKIMKINVKPKRKKILRKKNTPIEIGFVIVSFKILYKKSMELIECWIFVWELNFARFRKIFVILIMISQCQAGLLWVHIHFNVNQKKKQILCVWRD